MIKNMKIISLKFIILFFILTKCILANDINSVEIISDELEWNEKEKIAYARGNASAEQKDKIHCCLHELSCGKIRAGSGKRSTGSLSTQDISDLWKDPVTHAS